MRTIKFRGKRHYDGMWVYGYPLVVDTEKYKSANIVTLSEAYPDTLAKITTSVDFNTLGQFTSLYDKNHNEIYEGDILAAQGIDEKLEVRFVRGVFAFLWSGDLNNEFPTGSPTHEWAEVIGNIYDNPDLIKKGDNDESKD